MAPGFFSNLEHYWEEPALDEFLRRLDDQVKRAVELSAEKYCSASIMLTRGGAAAEDVLIERVHHEATKSTKHITTPVLLRALRDFVVSN